MRHLRRLLPAAAAVAAVSAVASEARAQRRVTGVVTGEGGAPLPNATVQVVGTAAGTYTNEAGRFTIPVPAGAGTIRVRRIGYRARTVAVAAGQADLGAVALERDVLQLEAQVVTGVGTTISRRNAANDVAVVSGAELNTVPQPTVDNALQGKIAGATVTQNSGAPGGGAQFRIRGANSILGNTDPLLIVDGVIISNDVIQPGTNAVLQAVGGLNSSSQDNGVNRIADLNPNDIENIEVLKGASASQIYGSRASNGVIIITTRKGQTGRPQFNLTQRVGGSNILRTIDERHYSLAEAYASGAGAGLDSAAVQASYAACGGFCDHQRELFNNAGTSYETDLSVRGGGNTAQYYVSGLAKRDGGLAVNTGYDKQSLRANLTTALGSRLNAQVSANLVHSLAARGFTNNDNVNVTPYFVFPATPSWFDLRAANGTYPNNPFTSSNPLQTFALSRTPEEVWRQIGAVTADYSVLANDRHTLTLRFNGGADFYNQQDNISVPAYLQFQASQPNPGILTLQSGNNIYGNSALTLAHVYRPAAGSSFTTSVGTQYEYRSQRVGNIVGQNVLAGQENVQNASTINAFDFRLRQIDLAYYAQEEFLTLGERLLLTAALRAQRSTVNGNQDKYYVFPKASASYRIPGLPSAINEAKLRLAYGVAGNPPLITSQFTPVTTTVYGGQNAVVPGLRLGAANIHPELQREVEGGVDLTFLNSRATLGVTGYNRSISDLLLEPTVAASRGFTTIDLNGGRMYNRGVEVNASGTLVQTRNVTWVPRLTFARNVNKVTALPDLVGHVQCLNAAGTALQANPLLCPRGFTAGAYGFDLGQGRVEEGASLTQVVGTDTVPGTGCSTAGSTSCVTYARKYGDTEPKFTLGFSNEVTVHGVRLYALLDWRYRFSIINVTQNTYDFFHALADTAGTTRRLAAYQVTAPYIQDGTFLMLREVTAGYTLPAALSQRILRGHSNTLSVEVSGRNLAISTSYAGLTPEVSNFGNTNVVRNQDLAPFPQSRTFFVSLNVGF
ncbi:SusC/RagA family TonB-linked outer membrane protein [Gemmatimonadetes bacterium T265]|nr:SusC/RagA family TonB-linked outer membrane protein [Gemmatimonadetes bacterium T265]